MKFYKPEFLRAEEVLPPEIFKAFGARAIYSFMDIRVLVVADQLRRFFGVPLLANDWHRKGKLRYRGYRPDSYYASPESSQSQHRFGRALDCDLKGITAAEVRDVVMNHQAQFPFIKRLEDGVPWVHFDVLNTHHRGIHLFAEKDK